MQSRWAHYLTIGSCVIYMLVLYDTKFIQVVYHHPTRKTDCRNLLIGSYCIYNGIPYTFVHLAEHSVLANVFLCSIAIGTLLQVYGIYCLFKPQIGVGNTTSLNLGVIGFVVLLIVFPINSFLSGFGAETRSFVWTMVNCGIAIVFVLILVIFGIVGNQGDLKLVHFLVISNEYFYFCIGGATFNALPLCFANCYWMLDHYRFLISNHLKLLGMRVYVVVIAFLDTLFQYFIIDLIFFVYFKWMNIRYKL